MIHPEPRRLDLAAEGEPEKEFNIGVAGRLPKKDDSGGRSRSQQRRPDPLPRSRVQADAGDPWRRRPNSMSRRSTPASREDRRGDRH